MKKTVFYAGIIMILAGIHAQAQNVKIAFIGNSITEGYTVNSPGINAYPGQLSTFLGDGYEIMNSGVSGCTLLRNGNKPIWDQPVFADALAFEPDIVFILLGTNDSKPLNWDVYQDEFYGDYVAMVDTFSTGDNPPEIWACLPPPAFSVQWDIRDSVIVNGIIPVIEQVIVDKGLNRLDFRTPFLGKNELFPDDIHPNLEGHRLMAKILYETLLGYPIAETTDVNLLRGAAVTSDNGSDATALNDGLWNTGYTPDGSVTCTFALDASDSVDAFAVIPQSLEDVIQYSIEGSPDNNDWTLLVDRSANTDPPLYAYTDTIQPAYVQYVRLNIFQGGSIGEFKALRFNGAFHGPVMTVILNHESKSYTYDDVYFTSVDKGNEVFSLYRDKENGMGYVPVFGFKNFDYTKYLASIPVDENHHFFLLSYQNGVQTVSDTLLLFRLTSAVEKRSQIKPEKSHMSSNYPNPFNPCTKVMYSADQAGPFLFQVVNLQGQEVYRTRQSAFAGETIELAWDGRNMTGQTMPSGVYVFKLQYPEGIQTQKAMLMR